MSAEDISRYLFRPTKRYAGVRMQQGRVVLDSDWNEREQIHGEQERRTVEELICARGTPNKGFRIRDPARRQVPVYVGDGTEPKATYDFEIDPGSFYVGGMRFENGRDGRATSFLVGEEAPTEEAATRMQRDWLQQRTDGENLPPNLSDLSGDGERHDLVYLRAWEQCVSAVRP